MVYWKHTLPHCNFNLGYLNLKVVIYCEKQSFFSRNHIRFSKFLSIKKSRRKRFIKEHKFHKNTWETNSITEMSREISVRSHRKEFLFMKLNQNPPLWLLLLLEKIFLLLISFFISSRCCGEVPG